MREYHETTAMAPSMAPVQPAPVTRDKARPTRYEIKPSALKKKSVSRVLGIDAEYCKYTLSDVSVEGTDILSFWEVRLLWVLSVKYTMTPSLNRPIRKSSPLCSRWLWTTSQSRQHPCLPNASSRQRRRLTPPNETG